jgi:hypothetical protein
MSTKGVRMDRDRSRTADCVRTRSSSRSTLTPTERGEATQLQSSRRLRADAARASSPRRYVHGDELARETVGEESNANVVDEPDSIAVALCSSREGEGGQSNGRRFYTQTRD